MKNFNPIRGTNDYLPKDAKVRDLVKQKILKSYQNNGYNLIQTPILESLDFLDNSNGGDNLKLMFKTVKRGEKLDLKKPDLSVNDIVEEGLRYDLTVPLARFYANNREKLPTPFKAIQIDYSFRAERPQRGRDRQFIQCDIDVVGDSSINAELELIKTTLDTFSELGFEITAKINDRRILNSILNFAGFEEQDFNTVCVTLDKIDKIQTDGVIAELNEKGFNQEQIKKLTTILDDIKTNRLDVVTNYGTSEQIKNDLNYLLTTLTSLCPKHKIVFDISIIRGQGYYTGTVYEFYTQGFSGAVGGGGRYDKMIGKITGQDAPAVGASIGFEPVTMLIKERNQTFDSKQNLALIYDQEDDIFKVFEAKEKLKSQYNVSLFKRAKNMKNFYEKIGQVADFVLTTKDYFENKPAKPIQ